MSEKLTIKKQILNDEVVVELVGNIDEDANFEELLKLKQPSYIFNFDKVTMINSCGIREWINFLSKLPGDAKIVYKNCPQIIIEQINMVHGFIKDGAMIESFYAPYYCEKCGHEGKIHLKSSMVIDGKAPEVACTQCNNPKMDFDAIEQQYFNFLKRKK